MDDLTRQMDISGGKSEEKVVRETITSTTILTSLPPKGTGGSTQRNMSSSVGGLGLEKNVFTQNSNGTYFSSSSVGVSSSYSSSGVYLGEDSSGGGEVGLRYGEGYGSGSGGGSGGGGGNPSAPAPGSGGRASSIFGAAKPVDTAAKEREVEERLKKQEERLQKQMEEDKGWGSDRKMRDRDPGWREETHTQRSRTGSESSQQGSTSRGSRCRDGERSGENEVFSGRESDPSSPGASPTPPSSGSSKEPLKVMPAPPPKENAWAKRSAASTGSYDGEGRPPLSPVSPSSSTPPKSSSVSGDERGAGKDENKADCVRRDRGPPKARGGPTGPGAGRGRGEGPNRDRRKEADRKDNRRDRDSKPPPEPKKFEETPTPKFSSASKYAALLMDGDDAEDLE